jgi:hypothetical protein
MGDDGQRVKCQASATNGGGGSVLQPIVVRVKYVCGMRRRVTKGRLMSDSSPVYFLNPSNVSPPIPTEDMLQYVADLLAELEDLAKQRQLGSLAAMLSLTGAEARRLAEQPAVNR